MNRIALVTIGIGILIGCSENGLNNIDGPLNDFHGRIEVAPPVLDFGTMSDGEEGVQTFTVTNIGDDELLVEDIGMAGDGSFTLLSDLTSFQLPPGASQTLDVHFTPLGSHDQLGTALVFSTDATNPEEPVQLLGYGTVPELLIDPPVWDFGADYVGCSESKEVFLSNIGTEDLVIAAIDYNEPLAQLHLDNPNALPLTLAPGQVASVWIDFESTTETAAQGTLSVTSNDPRVVVDATQKGEGVYAAWNTDHFSVPDDPPVDILFAIDQSCSMDSHSAQLASSFSGLIGAIQAVTTGWQIGVVTEDSGCFNSGILTNSTPNLQATFASAVSIGFSAYTEKLFALTQVAMTKTTPGQCNYGFLRPGALLHIVLVSDEYEQSTISASSFVSTMQAYKGSASMVKVSGIICGPSGCGHADGYDTKYKDAVSLTGGERLDVMATNWSTHAQALAAASLSGINRYGLSATPDANTIEVFVNGNQWFQGWYYDAATNEVVFNTNPPRLATIDIDYGVVIPCN